MEPRLTAARRSRPDAFEAGLLALTPKLRAYGRRLSGDAALADDLAQQTIERALRRRHTFSPGTNLQAWCYRILFNIFATQRRRAMIQETLDPDIGDRSDAAPANAQAVLELNDVRRGLSSLPAEQREALLLVAAGGMSYEEAAEISRAPVGTIKSRVARARSRLLSIMEDGAAPRDPAPAGDAIDWMLREVDQVVGAVRKAAIGVDERGEHPLLDAGDDERAAARSPTTGMQVPAVLLVEDEILVRELIEDALKEHGLTVEAACDGDSAVAMLERAAPSILVTDINLGPGPDGFEVARKARRLRPDVKVIYITGHAAHLGKDGVADALMMPKPFNPDRLAARVRDWLGAAA